MRTMIFTLHYLNSTLNNRYGDSDVLNDKIEIKMQISESWIDLNTINAKLYVKVWQPERFKSDIPIILLHDSLGSVQLWRDFPEELAKVTEQKVIAYDRLGFGQSSIHTNTLAVDFVSTEATEAFAEILQQLNIQNFMIMGHSVGGGMASCCAAYYQDRCKALITMSAQSMVEELTLSGIREAKEIFKQDGQLDRLKKYHGEKAQWVLDAWTETWLSEAFKHWTLDEYLQKIQCPMLIIHGELDEYGSLNQPQQYIKSSPAPSQLYIMENTHHMPHKEKPGEVLAVVTQFLEKLTDFTQLNHTANEQV